MLSWIYIERPLLASQGLQTFCSAESSRTRVAQSLQTVFLFDRTKIDPTGKSSKRFVFVVRPR